MLTYKINLIDKYYQAYLYGLEAEKKLENHFGYNLVQDAINNKNFEKAQTLLEQADIAAMSYKIRLPASIRLSADINRQKMLLRIKSK